MQPLVSPRAGPEREGTTETKIWAGLSWFCICACSKRVWGRRCLRPWSQPSTPLPATFPAAGADGLFTMHGRARPQTHHPHRLSSRFHTPTPLNGLCLKEGKQNKTKKNTSKKKKHSTPMLCALRFVVPTKHSDWAQQHLQNSLCLRLVPTLPKPPVVPTQCRGPEPPVAVPGRGPQSSALSSPCRPQPSPSPVTPLPRAGFVQVRGHRGANQSISEQQV